MEIIQAILIFLSVLGLLGVTKPAQKEQPIKPVTVEQEVILEK